MEHKIKFTTKVELPGLPDMGQHQPVKMDATWSRTVAEAQAIVAKLEAAVGYTTEKGGYPIVDTAQDVFYSNDAIIEAPEKGQPFYGQDAQFTHNPPSYTDNGDGTVTDNVTGLMWQKDPGAKLTWAAAAEGLDAFNTETLGGYSDWRIPTIKELFSLVDQRGVTGLTSATCTPYIDTNYFVFLYGDQAGELRFIDSQIISASIYGSTTMRESTTMFGYNFADGRIKGYPINKNFYCYHVRGNKSYGQNLLVEQQDGTITDEATGLMWMQHDSGAYKAGDAKDGSLDWEHALAWAQEMNDQNFLGYSDWRLPHVKELQSLVDYSRSPAITNSAAIDPLFTCTPVINVFGQEDYGYYWTSTTHNDLMSSPKPYEAAHYVAFGKGMGYMHGQIIDAHGAGSQRSDPKFGSREDYPAVDINAPQGDDQRIFNMVRLVRTAS